MSGTDSHVDILCRVLPMVGIRLPSDLTNKDVCWHSLKSGLGLS